MAKYGTSKYGQSVYGSTEHPYVNVSGKLMWILQVDWDGDGVFGAEIEPQTFIKIKFRRGRKSRVRTNGRGQEHPEQETCWIDIYDPNARYDDFNDSSPIYAYVGRSGVAMRLLVVSTTSKTRIEAFTGTLNNVTYNASNLRATIIGEGLSRLLQIGEAEKVYSPCQSVSLFFEQGWDTYFTRNVGDTPYPVNWWKGRPNGLPLSECIDLTLEQAGWVFGSYHGETIHTDDQPEYFFLDGHSAWDSIKDLADGYAARLFFLRDGRLFAMDRQDTVGLGFQPSPSGAQEKYGLERPRPFEILRNTAVVNVHAFTVLRPFTTPDASEWVKVWEEEGPIVIQPGYNVALPVQPAGSELTFDVEFAKNGVPASGSMMNANFVSAWENGDKTGTDLTADVVISIDTEYDEQSRRRTFGNNQSKARIRIHNEHPTLPAYVFGIYAEIIGIWETGTLGLGSGKQVTSEDADSIALNGRQTLNIDSRWVQSQATAESVGAAYVAALKNRKRVSPSTLAYAWSGEELFANLSAYDLGTIVDFGAKGKTKALANFGLWGLHLVVGQEMEWMSPDGQDAIVKVTYEHLPVTYPSDIAGLQIWLDASELGLSNGAEVGSWADLSGLDNHALQAAAGNKPVFVLANANINNRSTVKFDASNDYMAFTNILNLSTYTYFVVFSKNSTGTTNDCILTDTNLVYHFLHYGSDWYGPAAAVSNPMAVGTFSIKSCVVSGGIAKRYSDGVGLDGAGAATVGSPRFRYIGLPGFICNAEIAEIIVYSSALSDAERQAIEHYLKIKYHL